MRIVTYILVVLLVAALGAAAFFYVNMFKPMAAEYPKMQAGMQELDKTKAELKRFKDKESRETSWLRPAAVALSAGLADEIKAGKAEDGGPVLDPVLLRLIPLQPGGGRGLSWRGRAGRFPGPVPHGDYPGTS